jgi:ATP-dependent Clp protease ATP-binding subunit ClpX
VSAVERVLMKFEHTLPSTHIRHLIVTSAMVGDPDEELHKILIHPDDPEREAAFQCLLTEEEACLDKYIREKLHDWQQSYGTNLSDARIKLIIRHTLEQQTDVEVTIEEIQAIQRAVQDFAKQFYARNELEISFTDGAIDYLAENIWKEPQDLSAYLRLALQNYDHGLKLIREKTGKLQFIIPVEGVEDPEQFLNGLIQEAYRNM